MTILNQDSPIHRILVVDDEGSIRRLLTKSLSKKGFFCLEASNGEKAFEMIKSETVDLVISDISMPGIDGIEFMKMVKENFPHIDFIIMTGYASDYSYVDIMDAGASDYMSKPFTINAAMARISRIEREKRTLIDLRRTNEELCVAIERANTLAMEAKDSSQAKTFFLASMSHEIRTPLNGIVGYTDMLSDTSLNEEQISFVKNARLSCETLLSVVNDILDFSKVEAGKLTLARIEFDPEVVCFDTIDVIRTKVDESKVELLCSVTDAVPAKVTGDPHRFRQVLLNLLGNAVKFTREGSIELLIDATEKGTDWQLTVTVKDSGAGMTDNALDKIFKPFVQSDDEITQNSGGTGLGLPISKNIAVKMGGNVWAESCPGEGSTFYFTSFVKSSAQKTVKRIRPVALKGKKVLLGTNSRVTGEILKHELSLAGMDVYSEKIESLERFRENSECIDVGIIDFGKSMGLSGKEGNCLVEKVSPAELPFDCIACSIPVAGISDTFKRAGFKGFLPKPTRKAKLFDMISYVLGMDSSIQKDFESQANIITTHMLSENRKSSASILLVEDNPVNQKMTKLILSKAGYRIDIASNGLEAVIKYSSRPSEYDLIFMDINMPKMDGFEATSEIRAFEKKIGMERHVPIMALTANVLDDFKIRCEEVGMDDFLTKPIDRTAVFRVIQKWAF